MPSAQHQWLLLWALRKMTHDGFRVVARDGDLPQGGLWNRMPSSWRLEMHRPDALADDLHHAIALAEANNIDDVDTEHTRSQLSSFARYIHGSSVGSRLYIAVPRTAARLLDRVLESLHLAGSPRIRRLHIPDCLLGHR